MRGEADATAGPKAPRSDEASVSRQTARVSISSSAAKGEIAVAMASHPPSEVAEAWSAQGQGRRIVMTV